MPTELDYLLPALRLNLGDTDQDSYRNVEEWLKIALIQSLKELQRWWRIRYTIDESDYSVSRYSESTFVQDAPPTIEVSDEKPIILMASIIIKGGSLEANSWNVGSWRDAEFSVSNIEGSRAKQDSVKRDWEALTAIMKPPTKRAFFTQRQVMYGAEETNI